MHTGRHLAAYVRLYSRMPAAHSSKKLSSLRYACGMTALGNGALRAMQPGVNEAEA